MPDTPDGHGDERDVERRRKRAVFLRELNEAKALRERVQPRRARANRMRQQMRMRTFRW
jgi:16S rRNA G527 N7-methylase RsmG